MTARDRRPPTRVPPRRPGRTGRLHQQIEIGARGAAVQRIIRQKIEKAHDLGLDMARLVAVGRRRGAAGAAAGPMARPDARGGAARRWAARAAG